MGVIMLSWKYSSEAVMVACIFLITLWCASADGQAACPINLQKLQESAMTSQSATEQNVSLTIDCPQILLSGTENYITIGVRNDAEQPIEFYSVAPQSLGVGLEVSRQGSVVRTTALGTRHFVPSTSPSVREPIRIGKGQEMRFVVNLTRYFDLSIPEDTYQIVATWWGTVAGSDDAIRIRTKPLDFEVNVKPGESVLRP